LSTSEIPLDKAHELGYDGIAVETQNRRRKMASKTQRYLVKIQMWRSFYTEEHKTEAMVITAGPVAVKNIATGLALAIPEGLNGIVCARPLDSDSIPYYTVMVGKHESRELTKFQRLSESEYEALEKNLFDNCSKL
jgi:hypothetical protein